MVKSLFGKNPDLDDVDFIEAVEAAFGITFRKDEPKTWRTFGDVFDATCRHLKPVERGSFPCLAATAYRRIKRGILGNQASSELRPKTRLKDLIGGRRLSERWRRLEQDTELKLPGLPLSPWVIFLFPFMLLGVPALHGLTDLNGWIVFLIWISCGVAIGLLPRALPVQTVGDLARAAAALNAQELSQSHGAIRTSDVWDSLVWIARDIAAFTDPIERDTVLVG
jgi:hypothetical protein